MAAINIKMFNCYGIGEISYSFDFDANGPSYSVYAPNGCMKTSFAKALKDYSQNRAPNDMIYTERVSTIDVQTQDGVAWDRKRVLVVESYVEKYNSEGQSLLLVNRELRDEYESAIRGVDKARKSLLNELKQLSGLTGRSNTPDVEMCRVFDVSDFMGLVDSLQDSIVDVPPPIGSITYSEVFSGDTLKLLEDPAFLKVLDEYIQKYEELVTTSPILTKEFNHTNAIGTESSLRDLGFFKAGHSVNLNSRGVKEEVSSIDDLSQRLSSEIKRLLGDETLRARFDKIDAKLSKNAAVRSFRDYIRDHQELIPELRDYRELQKRIWIAYLSKSRSACLEFIRVFRGSQTTIGEAIGKARGEATIWASVVEQFNQRFKVPFRLAVKNQEEVILKGAAPFIVFEFDDSGQSRPTDPEKLLDVLSRGERRALYLLNVLFDIEARKRSGEAQLIIFDDVADSFDYKNKYAIVEYIRDVSRVDGFHSIVLSHNYDFHRCVSSRLIQSRKAVLVASRNGRIVKLAEEKYQNNPFLHWSKNLNEICYFIACIPFVRNLAEYCGDTTTFDLLTKVLHVKSDSESITIDDIFDGYRQVIGKGRPTNATYDGNSKIHEAIQAEAMKLMSAPPFADNLLECKIILAVASRLKAEQFMIARINDPICVNAISKNQTYELFDLFTKSSKNESKAIEVLGRAILITPEHIHLNSFMYEPLIDLGVDQLKDLYRELCALCSPAYEEEPIVSAEAN